MSESDLFESNFNVCDVIEGYLEMAKKIVKIMNLDVKNNEAEYNKVFDRMYQRFKDKHVGSGLVYSTVYELYDSVVDISYYLGDYINTCLYNGKTPMSGLYEISRDDNMTNKILGITKLFSDKACMDYYFATGKSREIHYDHIKLMVLSELFEFICILIMHYNGSVYDNDSDIFRSVVDILEDDDIPDNITVFDAIESFLSICYDSESDLFQNDRTNYELFEPLLNDVNRKNMLKEFKEDGRFHFDGMKVIKPAHWESEVDSISGFGLDHIAGELTSCFSATLVYMKIVDSFERYIDEGRIMSEI